MQTAPYFQIYRSKHAISSETIFFWEGAYPPLSRPMPVDSALVPNQDFWIRLCVPENSRQTHADGSIWENYTHKDQLSLTNPRDELHHGTRQNLKKVT